MRKDYRVKVRVEFVVDVGSEDEAAAMAFAEYMTAHVFADDYARAERVVIDAYDVTETTEANADPR